MKRFAWSPVVLALCVAAVGCGGTQSRTWRIPRPRAFTAVPGWSDGTGAYSAPVEPAYTPPATSEPMPQPEMAPPAPMAPRNSVPTPAIPLTPMEEPLPPPPDESEESVQFRMPAPPSRMPNALIPVEARPTLEQSSAERPTGRPSAEVLGEGKIALRIQGHSTCPSTLRGAAPRLTGIETEDASPALMQAQYVPQLLPTP
jgi:hypothetical protein